MEERRASVSGGNIRYLVGGSGPPLVLLHGIVASSFSFRLNCSELARHFRVFLPDLRILGLESDLAATADCVRQFLDGAGIESADILGSSHGGSVVMELAWRASDRFRRMILVSPANPFAEHYKQVVNFYLSALGGMFIRLAPIMPGRLWDYAIGRMYGDPSSLVAGTGSGYRQPLRIPGATEHIRSMLRTFTLDIESLLPRLEAISSIPSLLIWGDRDPVVELESGYRLQRALGSEMAVMKGVGHLPYEENPEQFNRIVLGFLKMAPSADPSDQVIE